MTLDNNVYKLFPLVQSIAGKMKVFLAPEIEMGDLVGFGMIGLLEASRRYDATKGAALSTFAYYRISGAIYDGLRHMGWLTRGRYKAAKADPARQVFMEPLQEEMGDAMISMNPEDAPDYAIMARQERAELAEALSWLSLDERKILNRFYHHDTSLTAIGKELGISKDRVSRIYRGSIRKLRYSMDMYE